ncbi:hypothetical protein AMIS_270 [Actinoplanes missouriensis 431]|uniref:Uncharacterized protein n=1 Tax=Actinoplanes missouriensis (strain ATCC 14538 / DSM 43046 / CBS 188.64 / JCM 3121 / NBRC 102363 / NCIMB 12654 / NRRL B-3342 / UNCC 431) TaxID=512565 RepID=I0GWW0_ACTM4|nr:hypothetical protein AMIS_270 [Actinoplanes missouriensis 431]
MVDGKAGRGPRTACRSLSIPGGGSPLMPSPNQGAERRAERRAQNTGSRWAVRALVVGGLAGAAWLLTGTAAHAADHGGGPAGSPDGSASHRVAPVSGGESTVRELLEAAVQPLEFRYTSQCHRRVVTSILATAERVLSGPVELPAEVIYDGIAIDAYPYGAEPHRKPAPSRTSGGSADDRKRHRPAAHAADPVTAPETRQPDAELPLSDATEPAAVSPVAMSPVAMSPVVGSPVAVSSVAGPSAAGGAQAAPTSASTSTKASRDTAGHTPARYAKAQSRSSVHRRVPAARPASPKTDREDAPVQNGPEPARMNLGTVSGIPANGSGSSPEVGPVAVLPPRVGNGAVDNHRFPFATDVVARRNDAVAPDVFPD